MTASGTDAWTSAPTALRHPVTPAERTPWWRSLRFRTAAAMTLLATTLVVAAGAVFAHTAITDATAQLRQQALTQLNETIATQAFGGALPPRATDDPAVVPGALRTAVHGGGTATYDDGTWMWAAREQASGLIATRVDNSPLRTQWTNLQRTFVVAAVLAAAFAAAGSWLAAGRLTARLRRAARAVDDTVAGRSAVEVRGDDEVAVLSRGLAETAAALARSLDHERAISAEVAHDMRTPVTALVGAAELLPDGPDAERVRRVAARLRGLLDDLLTLSRAAHEAGEVHAVPLDLVDTVDEVLLAEGLRDRVRFEPGESSVVLVDREHLGRALTNLIGNAERHGAQPVVVRASGTTVTVEDAGPGFPAEVLRDGPRRFGALGSHGGSGIGLAIVLQHVAASGAVLRLENTGRGAAAVVELRAAPGW
ncbi:sensor histidine kinase KdpD [Curtobacterium sp. ISL-83]|uniref:sensor histidine kinase n=1 Tax=Curtobacterium sp. ISL-83 TaxID=2819145 RepID=UPI001BEB66F5|nr:HAMP domain-containing sensor histidine kinase [Curtobacterium sp. ISL-83]MBT2503891.1 HAMP domain-containing histidine kinase [Curtobacterium sp. ISL-83]